jgi:hypothetical protein
MPPELHLDPDRLRAHARTASGLSEELWAVLRAAPVVAALADERERLTGAVGAAVRELADLGATLGGAAAVAGTADAEVAAVLGRLRAALGPEQV